MKRRTTMADVARQAGVHVTTVSLALRNHPSLPVATRERLRAIAEKLGYRPDPALRALIAYRRGASPVRAIAPLAYVTDWDTKLGWKNARAHARFHAGAAAKARELGYKLEHFWVGEPGMTHERLSDILFARGIRGVIVASHLPDRDTPLRLDWSRFSAVKIDYFPRQPELHNVSNDQRAIIQLAVRRALQAGYRRLGYVISRWWDEFVDLAWSAGFLAETHRLPEEDRIPILFTGDESAGTRGRGEAVSKRALSAWIKRHRPEVILSVEEFVRPQLDELGLVVPRDVAYIETFLESDGRTAGVRHNCERVGGVAVETLVWQLHQNIAGIPEFPTATLVEGTWIDGPSLPPRHRPEGVRG